MSTKYNEAMEHVQLTAEVRERILKNVENAEGSHSVKNTSGETGSTKTRLISFRNWQRYGTLAACLILVGILAALWPKLRKPAEEPATDVASYWAEEYDSLEELSESVGFPVEDIRKLPLDNAEAYYLNITGKIAHVMLKNDDRMIVFRKSQGSEDNSGDYNKYTSIREEKAGNTSVTLKSSDTAHVTLALWEKDGYSYSMSFDPEVPEEDALRDISNILH